MSKQTLSNFMKHFSRKPQPNEDLQLQEIFCPFKSILSLIGLFPYSIRFDMRKKRFKTVFNSIYFNSLCAVSVLMVMYAFYIVHVNEIYSANDINTLTNVLITQMNYLAELSTLLGQCTVAYICAFLNRNRYVIMLNKFCSIWTEIRTNKCNLILGQLRFEINVVAIGSLVTVIALQLFVNCTRDDGIWKIVLVTFSFVLPQTIQMIDLAFFYVLAMMLNSLLMGINQQLADLYKTEVDDLFIKLDVKPPSGALRKIEQAFKKTYELKCEVNEAFQAPLLMTAIQTFHCLVSEGYTLYHGWVAKTHTVHNIINNAIWIIYQVLKIYAVTYSGTKLMITTQQIGQTLHTIPTDRQDLRILMEIQHFAASMQYQEFTMSVYGYFRLDSTLMATMVATVVMYLVILVQFDKSALNTTFT